jgi:hypothetical protein
VFLLGTVGPPLFMLVLVSIFLLCFPTCSCPRCPFRRVHYSLWRYKVEGGCAGNSKCGGGDSRWCTQLLSFMVMVVAVHVVIVVYLFVMVLVWIMVVVIVVAPLVECQHQENVKLLNVAYLS